jgi:carboxypeptidase Q
MTTTRSFLSTCLAVMLLLPAPAFAQSAASDGAFTVSDDTRAAVKQLIGDSILNGKAYEYDGYLADRIGPRLTGSANYMRAADWAVQQFKSLGCANVHTENWTIAATWEPDGPATGQIVSPVQHELHIYSYGWSPSTPPGGITGEVIYATGLATTSTPEERAKVAGKIVFFDRASLGPHPSIGDQLKALQLLQDAAPLAIIGTGGAQGTQSETALGFTASISSMPKAQIGLEDSLLIKRLLQHERVTIHFEMKNRTRENVAIPNVVAEIPGSERPDEVVIIGAHLDSWQPGTGAQDNGTGAASVIEAARAIAAMHRPPRRTVRFILFGGEEEGTLGSVAYARAHMADMAKIDAVLVTDSGAQPARGWYVMAREDEQQPLAQLSPLLEGLGANGVSLNPMYLFQTDHIAFDVLGVPTLVLWNDQDIYNTLHHKANDTFDTVVEKDLTQGATMVTVTAYAIADSREPFAAHLGPADMAQMLKKADSLEDYNYLKGAGLLP